MLPAALALSPPVVMALKGAACAGVALGRYFIKKRPKTGLKTASFISGTAAFMTPPPVNVACLAGFIGAGTLGILAPKDEFVMKLAKYHKEKNKNKDNIIVAAAKKTFDILKFPFNGKQRSEAKKAEYTKKLQTAINNHNNPAYIQDRSAKGLLDLIKTLKDPIKKDHVKPEIYSKLVEKKAQAYDGLLAQSNLCEDFLRSRICHSKNIDDFISIKELAMQAKKSRQGFYKNIPDNAKTNHRKIEENIIDAYNDLPSGAFKNRIYKRLEETGLV